MSVSGRDRDPAFRRRKTTSSKPVEKKAEESAQSSEPSSEQPKVETPATPPPAQAAPEQPAPKDDLTTPVTEPVKKVEPPIETKDQKKKTSEPAKEKPDSNNGNTSKKSKMIGILVAIIFIIGLAFLGYYVVSHIMTNESQKTEEAGSMEDNSSSEEGEAHAGDVDMSGEGAAPADGEMEGNEQSDEMRETTLTDENSLENEMTSGESNSNSNETNSDAGEKKALSSVIKKKGDFEIPCWIVAFSANNKKPLANMNYSALEALGYDAGIYWIPKYFPTGQEMYKVYVGPYKTPEEAQAILPQIRNLQPDAYVMKIDE